MDVFDDDWYAPLGQAQDEPKREEQNFETWILNGLRAFILLTGAFIAGLGAVLPQLLATSGIASPQLSPPADAALLPPPGVLSPPAIGNEAKIVVQQSPEAPPIDPNVVPLNTASQLTADRIEQSSGVRIIRPSGTGAPGPLIIDVAKALGKERASALEALPRKPANDRPASKMSADRITHGP